jgi:hypothetical protein
MNTYIKSPTLSTSFSESGKNAKKRFDNILNSKGKKTGVLAFATIILIICIAGTMVACNNTDSKVKIAKKYILDNGYKIVSYDNLADTYTLTNENLMIMPYSMYWGFLNFDEIDKYIDKQIVIYQFTVTNHPLDNTDNTTTNQTKLWVMICDSKAVGGYSLPDYSEPVSGGVYSFDGKTLEEVKGMDFLSWQNLWKERYGSVENPKDRPNLYYTMPYYSMLPVKALVSSNSWRNMQSSYPSATERQFDEYLSIRPNSPDIPVWLSLGSENEKISVPEILDVHVYLINQGQEEIPIEITDNFITFMPPKDIDEYIYSVVIKFEKGTVGYDIKIVVEDNE